MNNIAYIYKLLLDKNYFYTAYLRIFLLFFSEKNKLNNNFKINLSNLKNKLKPINELKTLHKKYNQNINLNKNTRRIFIINGHKFFIDKIDNNIKIIKKQTNINYLLKYKLFNNINFFYILNNILLKEEFKIIINNKEVKNLKLEIINIYDKCNKTPAINLVNKTFDIDNNLKILDYYIIKSNNTYISVENFIILKKNIKVNYLFYSTSSNHNSMFVNFFIKQKRKSILNFSDFLSDLINIEIHYNFFLVGVKSIIKKKSLKISENENIDTRNCNVYHYNNKSQSNINFGALLNSKCNLMFEGNILIGKNIKKINANLKCEGLMLSNLSIIEFNPNMFINNNDVKCTHGASIGNINDNIKIYMKSRGIGDMECKKILIDSFKKKFLNKNFLKIKHTY